MTFDAAFLSHAILWLVGAMTLCAAIGSVGAMIMLGRSGYRKD